MIPVRSFSAVLLFALSSVLLAPAARAGDSYIRICNRGDTTVWFGLGIDRGLWVGLQVEGWWEYEPGNVNILGGCTAVVRSTGNGFYFAFAVKDANGRLVPVKLQPSGKLKPSSVGACLPAGQFDKRISWSDTKTSTCNSGELYVPFSAEMDTLGTDETLDITYTIKPLAQHATAVDRVDSATVNSDTSDIASGLVGAAVLIAGVACLADLEGCKKAISETSENAETQPSSPMPVEKNSKQLGADVFIYNPCSIDMKVAGSVMLESGWHSLGYLDITSKHGKFLVAPDGSLLVL